MADDFVQLNPGAGGDVIDAESVTFIDAPTQRERQRIQIAGSLAEEIVVISDTAPTGTEYGMIVRNVPSGVQPVSDNGSSITIDSAQLPSSLVSGRLDVVIGASLPTGSNSIGILGANSGIDIGDITVNNAAGASAVNIQDGGNSITIDGSVTAVDGGGSLTIDNSTLSVVGGGAEATALRVTIATNSTGIISIDDNGDSLTIDSTQLPAALVGGRLDVVIGTSLPAGTNSIGILGANSGVDIGDVTINNSTGASAVNIQDGGNSITIDGVVAATQSGGWTVTANAGTNLNTSALALNATLTDKSQFTQLTDGTDTALITSSGELSVLSTAQPSIDIGDVTINNSSGGSAVNIQDGGNSITVDGTVSVSGTVTVDTELPSASTLADATVNPSTSLIGAAIELFNGTEWDRARGDIANGLDVDVTRVSGNVTVVDGGSSLTIDNSTLSVIGSGTESTALRVTIATDSTGVVSIDDNGSSLTIDSSQLPAALVGGRLDVIVGASLPAGSNSIGILGANSGVDVGDVTINNASGGSAVNIQDGGNSITIDGSVSISGTPTVDTELSSAATLGDATTNPTTTSVGAFNELFNGVTWDRMRGDIFNGLDVDVTRLPIPLTTIGNGTASTSLRVTIANDSTGVIAVTDNGSSLTVDGTVSSVQSGTWTVQPGNTPNTTPWLASIHDGTTKATVRDLVSNDALNVAIVDGTGNHITSFAGSASTQYTEDSVSDANPTGTQLIARRRDTPSAETTTDGDVIAANATNKGELYVKHIDAIPVTDNGSSLTVDGSVSITSMPSLVSSANSSTTPLGSNTTFNGTGEDVSPYGSVSVNVIADQASDAGGLTLGFSSDGVLYDFKYQYDVFGTNTPYAVSVPVIAKFFRVSFRNGSVAQSSLKLQTIYHAESKHRVNFGDTSTTGGAALVSIIENTLDTSIKDDAAFTPGTSRVTMFGATLDDSFSDSVNEGDGGALRMSANRSLYINIRDGNSGERGAGVDVNGNLKVVVDANPGVQIGDVAITNGIGSSAVPIRDGGNSITVDNDGTFTVQVTAGSTTIAKSEQSAASNGDVGVPAMAIQTAIPLDLASADTYAMLQMSGGRLFTSTTIDNPLPIGTNSIGTLGSNTGVTIGAVEIAAAQTLATVTNLAQMGAAAISMNTGTRSAGTQRVTIATDDLVPVSDNGGSLTVDGSVTNPSIQVDDAAFTPESSSITMFGAEFDNSSPNSVDEGDGGALRMSANRSLFMNIRDAAGNERGANVDASSRLQVLATPNGTYTVSVTGTVSTDVGSAFNTDGAVTTNRLLEIGGTDGANAQTLAVDSTGAVKLAAGTNGIGKLTSNTGVDIGDVDVLSIIPGTGATNLGKAEDASHSTGDVGVMALAVRADSPAATASNNEYTPLLTDSVGRLWVRSAPVQIRSSITPTISNGVAYALGDVLGGLQTISNAARISGGSGILESIIVLDKTQAQRSLIDLLFFDRTVTVAADNAAAAMSDADMANCLGIVSIGAYNTAFAGTPLNSLSTLLNVGLPFVLNGTDLFVVAISRGTPTYTSTSDLIFIYTMLQD